ncbi:hypothetical protein ALC57_14626 [Trachymyrmex cornetzi]|uniref:Uncharacterized protein n=1 Tax=Trachymyrmex cornetzi TaxID=471704 RepID=A0A151IXZ4_9HYME|nr:hypothetical protein ALC57_14626 [Trachymyrmex cornetzi]
MGIVVNTIIGPHFFSDDVNATAQIYSEFLEETLPTLLEDVPLNILPNIIYQQDDHPAHTSYIRDQVYQTLPRNREDLIQRIQEASRNITPAILHKVRQSFMRRVAACLEESGGYFEHLL